MLSVLPLSDVYFRATTAVQRLQVLAAGTTLQALGTATPETPGFLLMAIAGGLISTVGLRSKVFPRAVGCLGIVATLVTLVDQLSMVIFPPAAAILMPANGLLWLVWWLAISRWLFGGMRRLFELRVGGSSGFADRDRVMALYGPISLIALPILWLILIGLAYSLMFWALDTTSYADALGLSGSSLTTLGFIPADTLAEQLVAFTEAGWGLILVALMITFLPSIYSTFSRRETQVAMLEVRAGDPPQR